MGEDGRGRDRCEMQLRRFILYVVRRNGPLPSNRAPTSTLYVERTKI